MKEIAEDDLIIVTTAAMFYAIGRGDENVAEALNRIGHVMYGPGEVKVRKQRGEVMSDEDKASIDNLNELRSRVVNGGM